MTTSLEEVEFYDAMQDTGSAEPERKGPASPGGNFGFTMFSPVSANGKINELTF